MKIILIILFTSVIILSQTQSDYLDYFPMHIGDKWTYQLVEYDYFNDDTLGISYLSFEITGDTILEDGFKYFVFSSDEIYPHKSFSSIDTANLIVYDGCYGEYKLDAPPDSIWIDQNGQQNWILIDTSEVGNLNITSPQIIFQQGYGIFNRTLSKGFGLSYVEEGDLGLHQRRYLVYCKINGIEYGTPVSVEKDKIEIPLTFNLYQNYPNPFNPTTLIRYYLNKSTGIKLEVFDLLGNKVKTLVNKFQKSGEYDVIFNSENLSSGIYFYKLKSEKQSIAKKMLILK